MLSLRRQGYVFDSEVQVFSVLQRVDYRGRCGDESTIVGLPLRVREIGVQLSRAGQMLSGFDAWRVARSGKRVTVKSSLSVPGCRRRVGARFVDQQILIAEADVLG